MTRALTIHWLLDAVPKQTIAPFGTLLQSTLPFFYCVAVHAIRTQGARGGFCVEIDRMSSKISII